MALGVANHNSKMTHTTSLKYAPASLKLDFPISWLISIMFQVLKACSPVIFHRTESVSSTLLFFLLAELPCLFVPSSVLYYSWSPGESGTDKKRCDRSAAWERDLKQHSGNKRSHSIRQKYERLEEEILRKAALT